MSARVVLAAALALALAGAQAAEPLRVSRGNTELAWSRSAAHGEGELRVSDGAGNLRRFALGHALRFAPAAAGLADGDYQYELVLAPDGPLAHRGSAPGSVPRDGGEIASGQFSLRGGRLLEPQPESAAAKARATPGAKDQVEVEDLVVVGHACVGLDCVSGQSFGVNSVIISENNTRIHFDDTSAAGPRADWELAANDSPSGTFNAFTLIQRGPLPTRNVLRLLGEAGAGSFWLDEQGRLGVGALSPARHLHILDQANATLRLEQDTSGGFTPATLDLTVDGTGFSMADAFNGTIPFTIRPGTPTGTLTLDVAGIGLGTPVPATSLHVRRDDGAARVLVEDTAAGVAARTQAALVNNGTPALRLQGANANWMLRGSTPFVVQSGTPSAGGLSLAANGDLAISGTFSQGSSRALKQAIDAVAPAMLLQRVRELPLYAWQYTAGADGARHVGPMAEDVHAAFGLGGNERALAPGDVAALAMVATQALRSELARQDAEFDALLERLARLEAGAGGAP